MNEADLINALVKQADQIRLQIRKASDGSELSPVVALIEFVAPIWVASRYGYKVKELLRVAKTHATDLAAEERSFLLAERKNSRVRGMTVRNIEELDNIAADIDLLLDPSH